MTQNRKWRRRTWMAGAGAAGLAGLGGLAYRASPAFWRQAARERSRMIQRPPLRPQPFRWPDRGLYAAWLGHSTVLLKIDGFTILTDPIFSERAGIGLGLFTLGIKRLVAPALGYWDLPRIDLILL